MNFCSTNEDDVYIAKEDVTLWRFKGDTVSTKKCPKGSEFQVLPKEDKKKYDVSDRYWEFRHRGGLFQTFTGFACRHYFYPKNFDSPEEMNSWYFGVLDRQETKELLLNEANGDGAYLVRYSGNKAKFSIK